MAEFPFDFRLLDLSIELHALEDHLHLIEDHIAELANAEEKKLNELATINNWDFDDPDFGFARQECDHRINFTFPRMFRGPYLVALYAVFEAGVTEISELIQTKQKQKISIKDLKGGFLERAHLYFNYVLGFELRKESRWQNILRLSEIRNALAHTNGRIDLLNPKTRTSISRWEKEGIGIYTDWNFILVDHVFTNKIFGDVNSFLTELIERYKQWDTA